jgi:hypothetical protein
MIQWRKSSRSSGTANSDCVEVADLSGRIGVRDSKAPHAGHLSLTVETFAALLDRVKRDELNI